MGIKKKADGRLWRAIDEVERRLLAEALLKFRGSREKAAEYLGIEPSYVYKLAQKHNLLRPTSKFPDRKPIGYREAMRPDPSSNSDASPPGSSPTDWLTRGGASANGHSWLLPAKRR